MYKEMGMVEEKLTGIVKHGGGSLVWKLRDPITQITKSTEKSETFGK